MKKFKETETMHITPDYSLEKAFKELNEKINNNPVETEYRLVLSSGVHRLTKPVIFDGGNAAAFDYSLEITGENDAVITSGIDICGCEFKKVSEKPYYAYKLPDNGEAPFFRNITCNGKMVTLAEAKEERIMAFSIPNDKDRKAPENSEPKLYVSEEALEGIDDNAPMPLEIWIKVEWQLFALRVVKIDRTDVRNTEDGEKLIAIHISTEDWTDFINGFWETLSGRFYHFRNHLVCLTQENSFFYDRSTRTLYFYPSADVDMSTAVISYATAENLLMFKNSRNVTVSNLTFTGTTSNYVTHNGYIAGQAGAIKKNKIGFLTHSAIQSENGYDFAVDNCIFHDIGGDGVNTTGITDGCRIENCRFEDVGMSAIRIGRPTNEWNYLRNMNCNIRIVNNYISHPGRVFTSNVGIAVASVRNLKLCKNTLIDTPYSAISVGWTWARSTFKAGTTVNILNAEIAYNRVENFMYAMKDGGAIYTLGGNCDIEDHSYYNFVHDNYCVAGPTCGQKTGQYTVIYFDGSSSNWLIERNVVSVDPSCPSKFSYFSYQDIPSQQVYNMMLRDNYVLNLDDPFYVLGNGGNDPERNKLNFLYQENNQVGLTLDTLDEKAKCIVLNSGAVKQ